MERTVVTRVRDFGAFSVEGEERKLIVYVPQENISQLKTQFQVAHPEQLKGKEVFVNLPVHRIYPRDNNGKDIGVFCNMDLL